VVRSTPSMVGFDGTAWIACPALSMSTADA
jgi:hypothetical protein